MVAVPSGSPRLRALDVEGWDLLGARRAVQLASPGSWTLVLFLGSHCDGCEPFWSLPKTPVACGLEPQDAAVIVTRGPHHERPDALRAMASGGLAGVPGAVVMSDSAWVRYRVHGAPFFVLVDGAWVVSEGVAWSVEQVALDVGRARRRDGGQADAAPLARR